MSKRLFILPTEHVIRKHVAWGDILHGFEWTWEDLICDIATPLLDEVSRQGINVLIDGDPTEVSFVGEIAYDIIRDLTLGDDNRPEEIHSPKVDERPQFGQNDLFEAMYAELTVIVREILSEIAHYAKMALDRELPDHFPSAILYERMMGRDVVLAVHYTPLHSDATL